MQNSSVLLKRIAFQLLLLLAIYTLFRVAFTVINFHHFSALEFPLFIKLLANGWRYDFSAICTLNIIYFILVLLPFPFAIAPKWTRFTTIVFISINSLAFLFEAADWIYFKFTFKRSTADVLKLISRKGDFLNLLPNFLVHYGYLFLIAFLIVFLFVKTNQFLIKKYQLQYSKKYDFFLPQFLIFILINGVAIIGIRGGFQYIPIGIRNAVAVSESKFTPIVLNTPFSIMSSYATPSIAEYNFMPISTVEQIIQPIKQYKDKPFKPKNVVIVILESCSKEFTQWGGQKSYTPFLDSIGNQGLVCTQAFANGLHSAEGIPAVIAGIPSFMPEPFTTSNYATNTFSALPSILQKKGYQTAFFHGGTNGTMSFDVFAKMAGFQHYYGRSEYANENDFDGSWGIWDEPFLQYFLKGINQLKQPFCTAVFTLNAHEPFQIPNKYKHFFPKGTLPIHQPIAYTDYALKQFFNEAVHQKWYKNTLFIIVPDHTSPIHGGGFYDSQLGQYTIPIIYFCPADPQLKGQYKPITQQIDILPTVLDYLGYNKPFFAFGNSIFKSQVNRFVVNELMSNYQWIQNDYTLKSVEQKPQGLFKYPQDSMCMQPLNDTILISQNSNSFKAFLQLYHYALIHNKMDVSTWNVHP